MDAPQLVESQREAHVVGGIEAGEDGVRGFDAQADTVRIDGVSADSQSVAGSAADGAVDGLIGLRLDEDQRIVTIGQDVVERVAQLEGHLDGVLAFGAALALSKSTLLICKIDYNRIRSRNLVICVCI